MSVKPVNTSMSIINHYKSFDFFILAWDHNTDEKRLDFPVFSRS